jgi:hypothetical protein
MPLGGARSDIATDRSGIGPVRVDGTDHVHRTVCMIVPSGRDPGVERTNDHQVIRGELKLLQCITETASFGSERTLIRACRDRYSDARAMEMALHGGFVQRAAVRYGFDETPSRNPVPCPSIPEPPAAPERVLHLDTVEKGK